jgi:UDP-3-O-[3-hydroxymyristoyl] glucosamine N-acyltransferase
MDTSPAPKRSPEDGLSVAELAKHLGRTWVGDGDHVITDAASVEDAGSGDLVFIRSEEWIAALARSGAGAVILPDGLDPGVLPAIHSPNPALDFARAVAHLLPGRGAEPGIDPRASIADGARVDPSASIGSGVAIAGGCDIGARSVVHAQAVFYPDVVVGQDCLIHARVVLGEGTVLGDRVIVQPGAVIGGDGFGYVPDETGVLHKVPQVGRVVIEDDVEIGANTTIDRATLSETRIRRGAKIDNLVQIAHNCDIGEDVVIAAQSGISGSTRVGRGAIVMAQVGVAGHLEIGSRAFLGARAGLHKNVDEGDRVFGTPQMEGNRWHRAMAALARLPDALKRLRKLERHLGLLDGSAKSSDASPTEMDRTGIDRNANDAKQK